MSDINTIPDLLYLSRQINQAYIRLDKIFGQDNWKLEPSYLKKLNGILDFIQIQIHPDCQNYCPAIFDDHRLINESNNIVSKDFFLNQIPDPKIKRFVLKYT